MPLGHVFMAIDIEPLIGLDKFKANAGELLRGLRASTKDPNGPQNLDGRRAGTRRVQRSYKTGRLLGAARVTKAHGRAALIKLSPEQRGEVHAVPLPKRRTARKFPLFASLVARPSLWT